MNMNEYFNLFTKLILMLLRVIFAKSHADSSGKPL